MGYNKHNKERAKVLLDNRKRKGFKMNKNYQARQGDIFFQQVPKPPQAAKKTQDRILAYGEVTGHSHKVVAPSASEMEILTDADGTIYMMSPTKPIEVGHDEHGTIELPANTWFEVGRQREYDPLAADKERRVID